MSARLKKKITRTFAKAGLNLKKEALVLLLEFMSNYESPEQKQNQEQVLLDIVDRVKRTRLDCKYITFEVLEPVVMAIHSGVESKDLEAEGVFEIIDAFKMKKRKYDCVGKRFHEVPLGSRYGSSKDQAEVFRERYEVLLQRILRFKNLRHARDAASGYDRGDHYEITTTQDLLGESGVKCILGLISEVKEGEVWLEDTHGNVKVELPSESVIQESGFYTYHSFILAEGEMIDGVFKVNLLAFPPYEGRERALNVHPNLDFVPQNKKQILIEAEEQQNCSFVFLSNVHLDEPRVTQALERLLSTYASIENPPVLIVMMGNFTKERLGNKPANIKRLQSLFDNLCDMICRYRNLVEGTKFVFSPGPQDPGLGNSIPRPGLAKMLVRKLAARLSDVHFPSSPFRIRWFTQEIMVAREDLQRKFRRNTVLPCELKNENEELSEHLVKTIMSQAHLSPLPLVCQPVYWAFDHALSLYPPPTAVILGDPQPSYQRQFQKDCWVVNPGEFSVDFQFMTYFPGERAFDMSEVPL